MSNFMRIMALGAIGAGAIAWMAKHPSDRGLPHTLGGWIFTGVVFVVAFIFLRPRS